MSSLATYQALAREIEAIGPLIKKARWEHAAGRMNGVVAQLEGMPAASETDRDEIKKALVRLAEHAEQVRQMLGAAKGDKPDAAGGSDEFR
ncbi:MAG: hypothetical protein LBG78_09005 [Azoarcus sp.]|jgi:hypothetical protein|nr:hypothetical protein [Azoarcus sp.]